MFGRLVCHTKISPGSNAGHVIKGEARHLLYLFKHFTLFGSREMIEHILSNTMIKSAFRKELIKQKLIK